MFNSATPSPLQTLTQNKEPGRVCCAPQRRILQGRAAGYGRRGVRGIHVLRPGTRPFGAAIFSGFIQNVFAMLTSNRCAIFGDSTVKSRSQPPLFILGLQIIPDPGSSYDFHKVRQDGSGGAYGAAGVAQSVLANRLSFALGVKEPRHFLKIITLLKEAFTS